MGLDINSIKLLLYAKSLGVDFSSVITIGRQSLNLGQSDLIFQLNNFGYKITESEVSNFFNVSAGYAEHFLKYIGAKEVHSLDYSDYEGATHIHDMNTSISDNLKGKYSVVIDGGSLEHIFNFPVAIKNCMEMVHLGGHFIGVTPTNNFMGHGFYQFSPELYFSIFSMDNGYKLKKMIVYEDKRSARYYSVKNPTEIKKRVTLTNSVPAYLNVIAWKIKECAVLEKYPQQSDYVQSWNVNYYDKNDNIGKLISPSRHNKILNWLIKSLPASVKWRVVENIVWFNRFKNPFHETIYEPINPSESKSSHI